MRRLFFGIIVASIAFAGCKASSGGGSNAARVALEIAPNIDDYHVENVAVLTLTNNTGDKEADEMSTYMTQALYETGIYHFVTAQSFARDAKRSGVEAEHARMVSTWRKKRTADGLIVRTVLAATGYDAVVAYEVTKWEEVELQPDQEGTADTSVGIVVKMYGADGELLWGASDLVTKESIEYLPSYNTRSTVSGEARTTSSGAIPDPPPIEGVAAELARNVASTMPTIKGKDKTDDASS